MSPISIPTLSGKTDYQVETAIKRLRDHADLLERQVADAHARLTALPAPLTLQQIRDGLSATGAAPLNLTGLLGMSANTPSLVGVPPVTVGTPRVTPPSGPWPGPQAGTGLIRINQKTFTVGAGGPIWPWRGCTDFLLFKRWLDGENIAPILADRVAVGANVLRVFGMCFNITLFAVSAYANYFVQLPLFAAALQAAGLQLEFVVFTDCQNAALGMTTTANQLAHLALVLTALAGVPNVFIELVNEWPQNGVDPSQFTKPTGILSAAGSGLGGGDPFLPPWDYVPNHSPRDSEWPRKTKDAQDIREGPFGNTTTYSTGVGRPVPSDEPPGAGDTNIPWSRSTDANDFYWYGAGSQMFGCGGTFHSDNGIQSVLFDAVQQPCAAAFFQGLIDVPPATQLWNYTRTGFGDLPIVATDLPDPAGTLRTYGKISGNAAVVLAIRPGASWTAVPIAPWTITGALGPGGTLLTLTR